MLMTRLGSILLGLGTMLTAPAVTYAQRGLPPKKSTRNVLITKYPQHLDFLPKMVRLLKVPDGWTIKVAASGLGRPRMMYSNKPGELYVTRRDGGDVLLLKDTNGDHVFDDVKIVAAEF